MYSPTRWPTLATRLNTIRGQLLNATSTPTKRSFDLSFRQKNTKRQVTPDAPEPPFNYDIHAITCADAVDPGNTTTQMVFDEIVRATREVSPMFGPIWNIAGFVCHKWPVRAVERHTGPWNKNLSNPILVIGNEADPITPYKNAKSVADALGESAVLIEQDDYGHVSLAMKSNCTFAALNNYFLDNQLPSADQFCGTNQVLFPGPGITKGSLSALPESGSSNLATSNSNLEADLEAARARGKQLFIAVVALGFATGLLLICLVGSFILGRKKQDTQKWIHVTREMFEKAHEVQGHVYATPYDPVMVKKAGGYSRVDA
ncbi:hypothetical protein FRC08_006557 [Ceratobasidium sp. 394]|nr:hypothetical protein FRC08_006557 [Ceratobasidium sp. 394]